MNRAAKGNSIPKSRITLHICICCATPTPPLALCALSVLVVRAHCSPVVNCASSSTPAHPTSFAAAPRRTVATMVRSASLTNSGRHKTAAEEEPSFINRTYPPAPIHPFPGFRRGNLLRVEMNNFLTFSSTTIQPGPRMNLIIGPNGTGKSSVANAVCIVFGGHPRLLGRSSDLGGFVKHGTHQAVITALIYDDSIPSGVRSVSRRFDTDGKNDYLLDGQRCPQSRIISDVCNRYDIQLDNRNNFV